MFIPIPIILFVTIIYISVTNKNESLVVKTISTGINNFSKLPRKTQMIQITKVMFAIIITTAFLFASIHAFNSMCKTFDKSISNIVRTQ